MGAESEEPRRHDLHRLEGPLRHHPDRRRGTLPRRGARNGLPRGPRMGHPGRRQSRQAAVEKPQNADGRHRSHGREGGHPARSRSAPLHHRGGLGRRRRPAHEVPLPRPAASAPATQHDPAPQDGPGDPPLPLQRGIPRDRNPLPGGFDARRSARLRRAEPHVAQPVLRPAPIAADAQAAADGRRLRQVFPDRALLPRRGPARRPPARVHADRLRNVVRRAGGRARNLRALGQAHVQTRHGNRADRAAAPHAVDRSDGEIRFGQTRPALRHGVRGHHRPRQGARLSASSTRPNTSPDSPPRAAPRTPASRSTR